MVVKTRSHNKNLLIAATTASASDSKGTSRHKRGVKIHTPSFREASIRNYKVYTGGVTKSRKIESKEIVLVASELESADVEAAEVIMDIYESKKPANSVIAKHTCINPIHPITRYMYRIAVYNSDRTLHYKTAYILYNSKNRMYYVYSIVSNCYPDSDVPNTTSTANTDNSFPEPIHTLQMKYSSYINDIISNYIMTMIVPSNDYDYSILDDIIGVVASDNNFAESVFGEDSSYYDVDHFLHDKSSCETTNGFKSFQLIPSRSYWFDPLVSSSSELRASSSYASPQYTQTTIHSILPILSHCQ